MIYTRVIGEIKNAANTLRYFAGWSDKDHGKTIPWGSYFDILYLRNY